MADPKQPFNSDDVEQLVDQLSTSNPDTTNIDRRFLHDLRQVLATEDVKVQMQQDQRSLQNALTRITAAKAQAPTRRRTYTPDDRGVIFMELRSIQQAHPLSRFTLVKRTLSMLAVAVIIFAVIGSAVFFIVTGAQNQLAHHAPGDTSTGAAATRPGTTIYSYPQDDIVTGIEWTHDGKRVFSTGSQLYSWDAFTGKHVIQYPVHTQGLTTWLSSQLSPDNKMVAVWQVDHIVVLDAHTGKQLKSLTYPFSQATEGGKVYLAHIPPELSWSPDGNVLKIIIMSPANAKGSMPFTDILVSYNVATGQRQDTRLALTTPLVLSWSPDGKYLAAGDLTTGIVSILDATSGQIIHTLPGTQVSLETMSISWSPDSKQLATTDVGRNSTASNVSTYIWNVASATKIKTYLDVTNPRWSPDGKYLAFSPGDAPSDIKIMDTVSGRVVTTYHHGSNGNSIAWSPDSKHIASGGDGLTYVWVAVP
ncbi:hypothetical protein KDW_29180 [Dictyobacter vulcani]|uniref:Anaphase-promoting complex subunit 4-like WD40 domain-containing protein n=1 Tax=Dictyobacter vulcani TaxID=2607529 RepID=A0A5J4KU78_9CHLR|nr:PD40 domain-containing protein [Dictyobacter vulcani]GER88756.1 hypothetical protein KDW_29180 [Dictyobacter vulcani]